MPVRVTDRIQSAFGTPGTSDDIPFDPIVPVIAAPVNATLEERDSGTLINDTSAGGIILTVPETLPNNFYCYVRAGRADVELSVGGLTVIGDSSVTAGGVSLLVKEATTLYVVAFQGFRATGIGTSGGFPTTQFEVITGGFRTATASDNRTSFVFGTTTTGQLILPDGGTLVAGEYYVVVTNNLASSNAVLVEAAANNNIIGVVDDKDLLEPGETAAYAYVTSRGFTWQRIFDAHTAFIPDWPASSLSPVIPGVNRTLDQASWPQAANTVFQGGGVLTLPNIINNIAVGQGIRIIATNNTGFQVVPRLPPNDKFRLADGSTSQDIRLFNGEELLLVRESGTNEMFVIYQGPSRGLRVNQVTTIGQGVTTWGDLSGVIRNNEIVDTLNGLAFQTISSDADNFHDEIDETDSSVFGTTPVADTLINAVTGFPNPGTFDVDTFGTLVNSSGSNRFNHFIILRLASGSDPNNFAVRLTDGGAPDTHLLVDTNFNLQTELSTASYDVYLAHTSTNIRFLQNLSVVTRSIDRVFHLSDSVRIRGENLDTINVSSLSEPIQAALQRPGLTTNEKLILDAIQLQRGGIPDVHLNSSLVLIKQGAPVTDPSAYVEGNSMLADGSPYTVLVEQPNEVLRLALSNGGTTTVTPTATPIPGYNAYTAQPPNLLGLPFVAAADVQGGIPEVNAIRLPREFLLSGASIDDGSVTADKLDADTRSRFITDHERDELSHLHFDQVQNATIAQRDPNLTVRFASFFDLPSGTYPPAVTPENEITDADITFANASAATDFYTSVNVRSNERLTGPGLVDGGFDIVSANGVLDLTEENEGIVIAARVDAGQFDSSTTTTIWSISDSAIALVVSNGQLEVRAEQRDDPQPTTTSRTVTDTWRTSNARFSSRWVPNINEETFFVPPSGVGVPLTAFVHIHDISNGNDVGTETLQYTITNLGADQGEQTFTVFAHRFDQLTIKIAFVGGQLRVRPSLFTNIALLFEITTTSTHVVTTTIPAAQPVLYPLIGVSQGVPFTVVTHIFKSSTGRIAYQVAVDGEIASSTTTIVGDTHILVTDTATFENPTIEIGGATHNFEGILQHLLVASLASGYTLSDTHIAELSNHSNNDYYELLSRPQSQLTLAGPIVLTAPNGTKYRLTVKDNGQLETTEVV